MSLTISRSLFRSLFASEDFPTFGLPAKQTHRGSDDVLAAASGAAGPSLPLMASLNSPIPRPCSAETGKGLAQAEPVRRTQVDLFVAEVRLVHDKKKGLAAGPQARRDALVQGCDAGQAVHEEQDEVGRVDGEAHLFLGCLDELRQGLASLESDAPCVDQHAAAFGSLGQDGIPGHAWLVMDYGDPPSRKAVEKPALAHIGPAHDRNGGGMAGQPRPEASFCTYRSILSQASTICS